MTRMAYLIAMSLLLPGAVSAQNAFESSQGQSSIAIDDAAVLSVNFSDSNVKFGVGRRSSRSRWSAGIQAACGCPGGRFSLGI